MEQNVHHLVHLLHAAQLQRAVEVISAGAQVGAGQAHIGQPGAVGAAADGLGGGGEAGKPGGLVGVVHQVHTARQLLLHIKIAVRQGELDFGGGVDGLKLGGGPLEQALFHRELPLVVVPDDVFHPAGGGGAVEGVQVEEALIALRLGGNIWRNPCIIITSTTIPRYIRFRLSGAKIAWKRAG